MVRPFSRFVSENQVDSNSLFLFYLNHLKISNEIMNIDYQPPSEVIHATGVAALKGKTKYTSVCISN